MGLRKASAYSKKYARPYTRKSKKKSQNYIKTIPQQKIVKFKMGAIKDYETGKLKNIMSVVCGRRVLIRDNSIEASRQIIHRFLEKEIPGQYYLEVKVYPHHILRENKVYSGSSKGERVNTGMAKSFGSVIGRAAMVADEQPIFLTAFFHEKYGRIVRKIYHKIRSKLPCRTRIVFEKRK
ncbi:MAG: 50S ribosomal protein L16 [Nanoarchaeota archaeon]